MAKASLQLKKHFLKWPALSSCLPYYKNRLVCLFVNQRLFFFLFYIVSAADAKTEEKRPDQGQWKQVVKLRVYNDSLASYVTRR